MAGKVLNIDRLLSPDELGTAISNKYVYWESLRSPMIAKWKEIAEYVYATDTTFTSNSKLPWSNKTTIPKLCQIRDNLHANYMAAMFPKRKWMEWVGSDEADEDIQKKKAIEVYMGFVTDQNQHYETMSRIVCDFIDYGNCFVMPSWQDSTAITPDNKEQVGYVGPSPLRVSPLDIVFNPTAPTFEQTPKIIRSIVSLGELKKMLLAQSKTEEDQDTAEKLYEYLRKLRLDVSNANGPSLSRSSNVVKDRVYNIAGFANYSDYLLSGDVEVLTFYGDIYEQSTDTFHQNVVIKIVDRHKIIYNKPNGSVYGYAPIFACGWRIRSDSLWAMSPLENLIGMQYRIDHLENMKADCFDLIAYPPLKIKGYVEDFNWAPMERIYVGDDGDVEMLSPDTQALQADTQIAILEAKMEEMAGAPKEAMGFRTPGEKTKYEVQRQENAASRIFQNKTAYFERNLSENLLNSMLELARRNLTSQTIRIFDNENKIPEFLNLTKFDLTGTGRIRPLAARHFAEQAEIVQNLTAFFASSAGQDQKVSQHFSGLKMAQLWESILELEPFHIVSPYVALQEQADAQRLVNTHQQQVALESQTASGLNGDFDREALDNPSTQPNTPPGLVGGPPQRGGPTG